MSQTAEGRSIKKESGPISFGGDQLQHDDGYMEVIAAFVSNGRSLSNGVVESIRIIKDHSDHVAYLNEHSVETNRANYSSNANDLRRLGGVEALNLAQRNLGRIAALAELGLIPPVLEEAETLAA